MEFNAQRYRIVRKRIINGVIFLLCFILILTGLNQLLINKSHRRTLQYILYEAPENYYDALYVGGSHMNGAIAPSVLLESDGIRGFNLATGGQEFRVTYYLLKEVLKRQSPRLVVLDVYYMLSANRYGVEAYNHYVVDAMQFSKNKIDLIQNCIAPEDRLSFYIPFLKYHSRWNDLNKDDFTWKETSPADGWGAGTLQYNQEMSFSDWSDECAALPAGMEEYLDKFITLSQEMGFTLVLANFPNDYDWTKGSKNWMEEPHKGMNEIVRLAKAKNVPMYDLNTPQEMKAMNFNFSKDMNNGGHLNQQGAKKLTAYFRQYLCIECPELFS